MNRISFIFSLAIMASSALVASTSAQHPKLKLRVNIPDQAVPMHIVHVKLICENADREAVLVKGLSGQGPYAGITVEVKGDNKDATVFRGATAVTRFAQWGEGVLRLEPNEMRELILELKCRWKDGRPEGVFFPNAGTYYLRFSVPTPYEFQGKRRGMDLISDWHEIRVNDPTGADAEALKSLRQIKHACWLLDPDELQWQLSGAKKSDQQREWAITIETFLKEHPKSYWTPFAHHSLGLVYFELGKHSAHAQGSIDRQSLQKAAAHLEIAADVKDFPYAPSSRAHLHQVQEVLKNNPPPAIPPP